MKNICRGLLLLAVILPTVIIAQTKPAVAKEPLWVTINSYDYSLTSLDDEAEDGYADLVYEKQVSLPDNSVYWRRGIKIITESGVQNNSEITVNFDPSYEKLTFHTIRVIRGKQVIDKLNVKKIETIRQETELDRFIYNGSLTSLLILDDIRKGDIIDYSYTISGFNPIYKGKYADEFRLNFTVPIYNIFYKLISTPGRHLIFKERNSELVKDLVQGTEKGNEYQWKMSNVHALHLQDAVPGWYDPFARILVSEYNSWKEINDWAMSLFPVVNDYSEVLRKKIDELKQFDSDEKKITEALRFVQDDIRYMGIEVGENSHKPNHPNKIMEQRFGDCKDKSYLLVTILRALGIDAHPVLTSDLYRKTAKEYLPSPGVFDHVTVCVNLNKKLYWFDATSSYQRGSINDISYPDYQCGLVIAAGTTAFTDIPLQEPGKVIVNETINILNMQGKAEMVVSTKYTGSFADNVRYYFNTTSTYEIKKSYKNYYAVYYENVNADSVSYEDDEKNGMFTTKEVYTIPGIFEREKGVRKANFGPFVIDGIIHKPKDIHRTMPIAVTYPARYEENILVNLPEEWDAEESSDRIKCDVFTLNADFTYHNSQLSLHYELENLKDFVSPEEADEYSEAISKKENNLGYSLSHPGTDIIMPIAKKSSSSNRLLYNAIAAAVILTIVGAIVRNTRRR